MPPFPPLPGGMRWEQSEASGKGGWNKPAVGVLASGESLGGCRYSVRIRAAWKPPGRRTQAAAAAVKPGWRRHAHLSTATHARTKVHRSECHVVSWKKEG